MRASQFIVEYRRDKTAQAAGNKLIPAFMKDRGDFNARLRSLRDNLAGTNIATLTPEQVLSINNEILGEIESKDPTKNKQYVQWLARMYANGDVKLEDLNRNNVLGKYDLLKRRRLIDDPTHADINRFKKYSDFEDVVEWRYELALDEKERVQVNKGTAETVYEDENVRIVHPEDEAAACYYGQGTRWCTAATQGSNYFNHYNRQGPMYILIPKKAQYDGEKYQLHFPSEQFMNEEDHQVNIGELLTKRFPGLVNFFKKVEPSVRDWVMFADDDTLKSISERVKEILGDIIWETVFDWESSDDYFRSWQAEEAEKRGYVDDDGEIDWDRVYEDNELNDYTDYNYEAGDWVRRAQRALDLSPQEIRDAAEELSEDEEGLVHLENMDDVYIHILEDELGKDEAHTLTKWIGKHLAVKVNKDGNVDVSVFHRNQ